MYRPSRIPISCRNELQQRKNQSCRKSIFLQNNPTSIGTKTKEHFLIRAERSIYEGEPMSDDEVEVECRIWAKTLPHLRICGKSINKNYSKKMKSMNEDIIGRLIQDFLWNSFPDVSNKEQKRKKKSQSDKLTNKMHEKQIKTTKHFTLPAISNCHHNCLSHYTACLK